LAIVFRSGAAPPSTGGGRFQQPCARWPAVSL